MKNAKTFLQQGPLMAAGIEKFDLWKKDILQATRSVNLTEQEHWTTINRIIETRIDNDVYQRVATFFPTSREAMAALDPQNLLQQIETRLVTADQLEYKRLCLELARQKPEESPWQFENRLHSLYRLAQLDDEARFMEIFKKGIHNNKLRKQLLLHQPAITTIETLK